MQDERIDRLIADYLGQLEAALRPLPPDRRSQLRYEVSEHIDQARAEAPPQSLTDAQQLLARLGTPEEIAAEAVAGEAVAAEAIAAQRAGVQKRPRSRTLLPLPALLIVAIALACSAIGVALAQSSSSSEAASAPVAVPIEGGPPRGLAIDERRGVALIGEHANGRVEALTAARCGALRLSACEASARRVPGATSLDAVAVDERTGAVYSLSAPYPEAVAAAYCGGRGPRSCMRWRMGLRRLPQARAKALQRRAELRAPAFLNRLGSEGGRLDVTSLSRCTGSPVGVACEPSRVLLGGDPSALAVDEAGDTVYALDHLGGVVYVVNANGCNGAQHARCDARRPVRVRLRPAAFRSPWRLYGESGSGALALDEGNHTLYVGTERGVAMIDTATCNATVQRGCARAVTSTIVGFEPAGIAVDPSQHTVYVADEGSHSVSMLSASACDAATHSGCGVMPKAVHLGNDPQLAAIDRRAHTLFVSNENANAVDLIDTATCNAHTIAGCPGASTVRIGEALQRTLSGLARNFVVMRHRNDGPPLPDYGFGRSTGAPDARYLGSAGGKPWWLLPGPYEVCIATLASGGCGTSPSVIAQGIGDTGSEGGGPDSRVTIAHLVPDGARAAYVTKRDGTRVSVPIHDGFISYAGRNLRSLTIVRKAGSSTIGLP